MRIIHVLPMVLFTSLTIPAFGQSVPAPLVVATGTVRRDKGPPRTQTVAFVGWETQGIIRLFNGGHSGDRTHVSSASVWINSRAVARPSDFNRQTETLDIEFHVASENTLEIRLAGEVGATLDYDILAALPVGSQVLSTSALEQFAQTQGDGGDTLLLLQERSFSIQFAISFQDDKGTTSAAAWLSTPDGRSAVYVAGSSPFLSPAALFSDATSLVILQRAGGVRIQEDASTIVMNADDVDQFLVNRSTASRRTSASSVADAGACNPYKPQLTAACSAGFLKCLAGPTPATIPGCGLCFAEIGICVAIGGPGAPACVLAALSTLPCVACLATIVSTAGCFVTHGPCEFGGCECVTSGECHQFWCNRGTVRSGSCSRPTDEAVCAVVRTGPNPDDFFVGERSWTCSADGSCGPGSVEQCQVPDCRSCRDAAGGCTTIPEWEGYPCTTPDGRGGVCGAGACDTGGVLTLTYTYPENGGVVGGGQPNQASAGVTYSGPSGTTPPPSEVEFFVDGVSLGTSAVVFSPQSPTRTFVYSTSRFTPANVFGREVHGHTVLRLVPSGLVLDEKFVTAHTTFNPYFGLTTGIWNVSGMQEHVEPATNFDGIVSITGHAAASGCFSPPRIGSSIDVNYFGTSYTVTDNCVSFGFCPDSLDHTGAFWIPEIYSSCLQVTSPYARYWKHFNVTTMAPISETSDITTPEGRIVHCDQQSQLTFTSADLPSITSSWMCTVTAPDGTLLTSDSGGGTLTRVQ